MLLDGELPSGSRIPEALLCRRFGVSRTPLREALKVLAAEGFVTLRPNRGAIVAPVNPEFVVPLFEVKGALDRLIGLCAAERATEADIGDLEELHEALRIALSKDERAEYTRINYAFHQRLAQATQNPVLVQAYEALQQQIWRYRFAANTLPERLEESFAEHEKIIIALRARTRLDLAERLEEHNKLTGEAMARALTVALSSAEQPTGRRRRQKS
jgi:DNA-binding GntR family transcriptional regulator